MNLLIVTQYFPPEMGAPQARLYELASRLRGMGHNITVLTAMPNYPTGRVFDAYRGKLRTTELMDGIRVIRTCLYPSKSSRTLPRLFSYISFAVSCLLLGQWGIGLQTLAIIESPPLFLVPFALLISKLKHAKAVLSVADIWPDILIQMGHARKESLAVRAMYRLESFSYNHAAAVALTTPGMCDEIRQRFPHLPNVTILSNGVDTSLFRAELRDDRIRGEFGASSKDLLVGYCGLHGLAQGLEIVVDAAERLKRRDDIKFVMIGDGPTKEMVTAKADQLNLPNLKILSQRPKRDMPPIIASLDVSLMPLGARIPGAMPSKVYEALACGATPIVAKGTDAAMLLAEHQAGLTYEPGNIEEFVEAITRLADNRILLHLMRDNSVALSKRFDRTVLAKRSEEVLTAIAQDRPLPPINW